MSPPTYRMDKEVKCPKCGWKMDAATNMGRDNPGGPAPGDVSVCINCGQLLRFLFNLDIAALTTDEEVDFFLNEPPNIVAVVKKLQEAVKLLKEGKI